MSQKAVTITYHILCSPTAFSILPKEKTVDISIFTPSCFAVVTPPSYFLYTAYFPARRLSCPLALENTVRQKN